MVAFFSNLLLKLTYKSVYGDKAIVNISENMVEVVCGNKKIVHDKNTTNKIEETLYEDNTVTLIKYDDNGNAELEETYIDGEKTSEKVFGNGKATNVNVSDNGLETLKSIYYKDNVKYNEVIYKYHNKITETDYTVITITSEDEILKNLVKKKGDEIILDVQKKMLPDGRILYYKCGDVEIDIEYFEEGKYIKRYAKHWEEAVVEEVVQMKNKKNAKDTKDEQPKPIGVKIKKEILEYNERGNILHLETDIECIDREFDSEGDLKKQYNIIETKHGKEIVGKIITEDKDIKIINNSTLNNDTIVKLNEEMDLLELRYEDNLVMMYDFMFWDGGIEITEEYYQINNRLDFKKRVYDKLENNADYHIEETYKGNKLYSIRMINKVSKTELYTEGTKRFIKGFSGVEKEITEEEFEVYKMADALNKI